MTTCFHCCTPHPHPATVPCHLLSLLLTPNSSCALTLCVQVVEEQSPAEVLGVGDNLICQAIINSGIALGTEVAVKEAEGEMEGEAEGEAEGEVGGATEGETEGEADCEAEGEVEDEETEEEAPKDVLQAPDSEGRMTEIQVTEECVEMETEIDVTLVSKGVACYRLDGGQMEV